MAIKVHFLGGADEVGASCVLLEMGGKRILVDAGIRVSPKARDGLSGELLPDLSLLSGGALDAVIITHAHADHIGAIPLVVGAMPDVPVYTTPATISLMSVMFRDALKIMDSRLEAEGELPTYDLIQVQRVEEAVRPTDFRQEFSIDGSVNVTFYRAGHIPGAASIFLQSDEGSVLVSGDISFSAMRATPRAEIPPVRPDILILESTYGGRLHANRAAEERRIADDIMRVIDRGGSVLVPAFALGRAQEVALLLDNAMAKKQIPPINVYLDGMTRVITQVFERFPDYLARELNKHLEDNPDIFQTKNVHFVKDAKQRQQIMAEGGQSVVIASSGMLTGGASPYYAEALVGDSRNAIFITGYQDDEAPGKALQRLADTKGGTLRLNKRVYPVECEINTYALSAHADENELTQYAAQLEAKHTFLVHGDPMARARMRDLIQQRRLSVSLALIGDEVDISGTTSRGRRKDVPSTPYFSIAPITSLEELDVGLPLFDVTGELYVRNARKAIEKLLPSKTGLRKISFQRAENLIKLHFDFPTIAQEKYVDQIDRIKQMLGWDVSVNKTVNTVALTDVAQRLIPPMIGRLSVYLDEQLCEVQLKSMPDNWNELQAQFEAETGYKIVPKGQKTDVSGATAGIELKPIQTDNPHRQLEINEAYQYLRDALYSKGLQKAGLKNGAIILTFITPEFGLRVGEEYLKQLADEVGYPLEIYPNANQNALAEVAQSLCQLHDIYLVKNPSLRLTERVVMIEPAERIPEDTLDILSAIFHEQTAWTLKAKVV